MSYLLIHMVDGMIYGLMLRLHHRHAIISFCALHRLNMFIL
jgi:hypothetical protein